MVDFKLGQVLSILWKTKEFVLFRFLIYMGITLAYIIGTDRHRRRRWNRLYVGQCR